MSSIIYLNAAESLSPYHPASGVEHTAVPRLRCIEPDYKDYIDPRQIRRMSRVVKMGTAAAIACLRGAEVAMPDAILVGTAYGCTEDSEAFLEKLVAQNEELLTPTAFIQSTHNTIGAQIALLLQCHAYNNTFVHRAFSFEHALLDALLLAQENEARTILVGGVDELSDTLFRVLTRFNLYKNGAGESWKADPDGTVAGEGAAFFLLSTEKTERSICRLTACATFFKPENMEEQANRFLSAHQLSAADIDLLYLGKNGDNRYDGAYDAFAESVFPGTPVSGFKHLCGEYPVATAFATWLAARQFGDAATSPRNILIYNHFYNIHHSLILLSAC